MNKTKLLSLALLLLATSYIGAQDNTFDYLRIEMTTDHPAAKLMADGYNKEILTRKDSTILVVRHDSTATEIITYNAAKQPVSSYWVAGSDVYYCNQLTYVDEGLEELSAQERERLKEFYTIDRNSTKDIYGQMCFKVTMQEPNAGNAYVEMWVSEQLPNLPPHFPLSTSILDAQPVTTKISLMGTILEVEVVDHQGDMLVSDLVPASWSKAKSVSAVQYHELKEK